MIQALQHHKTRIRLIEDEKTSIIIGTLLHLPTQQLLKILSGAINKDFCGDAEDNEIQSVEFWPHWPPQNTTCISYVEPDVFIRFKNFDLIIETKKDDNTPHSREQWNNELTSYKNKYEKEKKKVYLIAIGWNESSSNIDNIFSCSWNNLFYSIEKEIQTIREITNCSITDEIYRILLDCKLAFEVLQFSTGWLYEMCDLDYETIDFKSIEKIKLWEI